MKDLGIYIPTLSRVNKQPTLNSLPAGWPIKLVVRKDEEKIYSAKYGKDLIMSCPLKGISAKRQWILENAYTKYVLLLDDDMTFNSRKQNKLVKATKADIVDMINLLYLWLKDGFLHVGISSRQGNNYVVEDYLDIGRMSNAYAYDKDLFCKTGVRFDRLPVMEDFDVTLSLLELGYPNRITYKYAWGQGRSGDDGGCSLYRTSEMQKNAAIRLAEFHPRTVKVVNKRSKTKWGGLDSEVRVDVIVNWKKAFKPKRLENNSKKGIRGLWA